jgi:copper chaperone CopZ
MAHGIRIMSAIPGRVRAKLEALKRNDELAGTAKDALAAIEGVRSVEINTVTGSALVEYDPDTLDSLEPVLDAAEETGLITEETRMEIIQRALEGSFAPGDSDDTPLARGVKDMFSRMNQSVGDATGGVVDGRVLIPLALVVIGGAKLLTTGPGRMPAWYDYFWYAFRTFKAFH